LLADAARTGNVQQSICRLFAFSGVGIPLDRHFSIGNFVRDATNHGKVTVRRDGSLVRSYLDSEDTAHWPLQASTKPKHDFPCRISSEHSISVSKSIPVEALETNPTLDGFAKFL
jgi:hypothetical protein